MRLLHPDRYRQVFEPLAGKRVGYVRAIGNVGDRLIEMATLQLFEVYGIDWVLQDPAGPADVDLVAFTGGGNMGTLYNQNWDIRGQCLKLGPPVVILPQSYLTREDRPYQKVFVRELASLEYCDSAELAPDLALALSYQPYTRPHKELGLFLRRDGEGLFRSRWNRDPARRCQTPCQYLELAASYRRIITDRLHFAVGALIAGCDTTLLPNSYHKNLAVYKAWLRDLGCRFADSPAEALQARAA